MPSLVECVKRSPVIAAVRRQDELDAALRSPAEVLFLLGGEVSGLAARLAAVRARGKVAMVHVDLIDGLAKDEAAVRFVARDLKADGIISTRSNLISRARREGLYGVLRLFAVDSGSIETGSRIVGQTACDAVEVMPGTVVPDVIGMLEFAVRTPIIGGGLIRTAEQVRSVLAAGAMGVSTGAPELWSMGRE